MGYDQLLFLALDANYNSKCYLLYRELFDSTTNKDTMLKLITECKSHLPDTSSFLMQGMLGIGPWLYTTHCSGYMALSEIK